ncbi:MAG TPA: AGE family epimerase/isomerase, partial [Niabella sp.]|nr:AGE family epimerase/isomerase [Niabella sp.]
APHFEKMLYDNTLLVSVLSEAYLNTKNEKYKTAIEHTIGFAERELQHASGGFYAALDADSEGVEGKFYVWNRAEVQNILGTDAALYCAYYDITEQGNWEHTNILRVLEPLPSFAEKQDIDTPTLQELIEKCNKKLLKEREKRVHPALDDKVILSWNALMNTAYSKAYTVTGNGHYKQKAVENMQFLLEAFDDTDGNLKHVWKNDTAKFPAFLDDHAHLIQALLQLYRITADTNYLSKARTLCEKVIRDFSEPGGYFYYTPQHQQDVIVRKKEVYDGATPSGNAVMALNLLELGILFDNDLWRQRAQSMITGLSNVAVKYPTSFGVWLDALYQSIKGTREIVLIGDYREALDQLLHTLLPFSIIMASTKADSNYPLLKDKISDKSLSIFLCENYACRQPVFHIEDLLKQLK